MNDDELPVLLANHLKGKQWIIIAETENKREMEAMSNIGSMDHRRQLLAKTDLMWANVIEIEKRKEGG